MMIGIASRSRFPIRRSAGEPVSRRPRETRGSRLPGTRGRVAAVTSRIQTSSQMTWEFTRAAGIFVVRPGPWTPLTERFAGAKARPNGA